MEATSQCAISAAPNYRSMPRPGFTNQGRAVDGRAQGRAGSRTGRARSARSNAPLVRVAPPPNTRERGSVRVPRRGAITFPIDTSSSRCSGGGDGVKGPPNPRQAFHHISVSDGDTSAIDFKQESDAGGEGGRRGVALLMRRSGGGGRGGVATLRATT